MLRSCVCFGRNKRRGSSFEDSSSCRSSEIERGGIYGMDIGGRTANTNSGNSLFKLFRTKGWVTKWRKPGRGMSMTKVERTIKAALLIQRWYRRYLARMEVRRRYTWTIFQNIEYAAEQDQVRLYKFFNALLQHIPEAAGRSTESQATSRASSTDRLDISKYSDESDDLADEGIRGPERVYRGPHISFPLQKKDVYQLIDLFRKKKYNRLHAKYVAGILREAATKLKRLPNFNLASTAVSKQVTICGDLHGKLDDLLVVFHKNGMPSEENPYVFNGDFVDRGKKGLEVFLLLLSCFLAFPGGVHLNRGNHEDTVMNARYGFIKEVQLKYKKNSERLLTLIEEVYRWLPLGSIVNNRVLVVHGGISDTTDLDLMKSLDRGKYVSILRPPVATDGAEGIDKTEWKQVFDVMWSDPQHSEGCVPNSLRGAGTYFGPDITEVFLRKYKMDFIVRSHECKPDGYEFMHDGKLITIFSASNYYAIGSNKGAYLKLNPQLDTHFVQYISAASKTRRLTFRQRVSLIESSALQELAARLRENRNELEREFRKHDKNNTGIIPLSQWCEAMENATHLGLPWRLLREKLAPTTDGIQPNEVSYKSTLDMLDADSLKHAQSGTTSVVESLYTNKSSLEALFRLLDKDNSGSISLEEFGDAIDLLQRHVPEYESKEQLMEICKMMDINKDGLVDLNEFLEAFRLCEQAMNNGRSSGNYNHVNSSSTQHSKKQECYDRKYDCMYYYSEYDDNNSYYNFDENYYESEENSSNCDTDDDNHNDNGSYCSDTEESTEDINKSDYVSGDEFFYEYAKPFADSDDDTIMTTTAITNASNTTYSTDYNQDNDNDQDSNYSHTSQSEALYSDTSRNYHDDYLKRGSDRAASCTSCSTYSFRSVQSSNLRNFSTHSINYPSYLPRFDHLSAVRFDNHFHSNASYSFVRNSPNSFRNMPWYNRRYMSRQYPPYSHFFR